MVVAQKMLDLSIFIFWVSRSFWFLRFVSPRCRLGRCVAHVPLRLAVSVAHVLRACLLLGHACVCMWWVGLSRPFCFVCVCVCCPPCFFSLFSSPFSLSLSLSFSLSPFFFCCICLWHAKRYIVYSLLVFPVIPCSPFPALSFFFSLCLSFSLSFSLSLSLSRSASASKKPSNLHINDLGKT